MPSGLRGSTLDEAKAALAAVQLKASPTYSFSDTVKKGTFLLQIDQKQLARGRHQSTRSQGMPQRSQEGGARSCFKAVEIVEQPERSRCVHPLDQVLEPLVVGGRFADWPTGELPPYVIDEGRERLVVARLAVRDRSFPGRGQRAGQCRLPDTGHTIDDGDGHQCQLLPQARKLGIAADEQCGGPGNVGMHLRHCPYNGRVSTSQRCESSDARYLRTRRNAGGLGWTTGSFAKDPPTEDPLAPALRKIVPGLAALTSDKDVTVRLAALYALSRIGRASMELETMALLHGPLLAIVFVGGGLLALTRVRPAPRSAG